MTIRVTIRVTTQAIHRGILFETVEQAAEAIRSTFAKHLR